MNTIPSKVTAGARELTSEKYQVFSKSMKFEVPFEKNKFEYTPSDIKALTDSLKLNDYEIKDIQIRAYSSIEGPEKRNIELQKKRAESIIRILQGYQTEKIKKDVQASENWVEFLEDINENDTLNLARYFSSYSKLDWAEKILLKYVKNVDVKEDVLFYYLNLTIVDGKKTASPEYRTIMLNAININKERFCKIFNSAADGGITFQLLKDQYLKNMCCEGCEK